MGYGRLFPADRLPSTDITVRTISMIPTTFKIFDAVFIRKFLYAIYCSEVFSSPPSSGVSTGGVSSSWVKVIGVGSSNIIPSASHIS